MTEVWGVMLESPERAGRGWLVSDWHESEHQAEAVAQMMTGDQTLVRGYVIGPIRARRVEPRY